MSVGLFLSSAFAFVVAIGVLVTIHEFGHYLVARLCDVKVLRFSFGFGRPLVSRRLGRDGTEWTLSAIPLGGYVSMLGERGPGSDTVDLAGEDMRRAFSRKPVWQRALIVVAGPLANLLLAIVLYAALAMHGTEEPAARIAAPADGTPAAQAGLVDADRIVSVDGDETVSWEALRWQLMRAAVERRSVDLEVDHDGSSRTIGLDLATLSGADLDGDILARLGFALRVAQVSLARVEDGSAAQRGGLRAGDIVLEVDGHAVENPAWLRDRIRASLDGRLHLVIERDGERLDRDIVPDRVAAADHQGLVGQLGVALAAQAEMVEVDHDPLSAVKLGVQRTWETSTLALRMLGKMVVGEVSLSNISGPVTIADYAGQSARIGPEAFLAFLAAISISIGVLNLLPIPMLDGGHLLYHLLEFFKGKPLSERFVDLTQSAGLGIVVMLMAVALYNDLARLLA